MSVNYTMSFAEMLRLSSIKLNESSRTFKVTTAVWYSGIVVLDDDSTVVIMALRYQKCLMLILVTFMMVVFMY